MSIAVKNCQRMSNFARNFDCESRLYMIKYAHAKEKIHSVQKKKASTQIVSRLISTKIIF